MCSVEWLVLDEADKLFEDGPSDSGFRNQVRTVLYCHLSKHVTILYNDEVCNFALHLLSRTGNSGWLVGLYFDPPYLYLIKVRKVWGTLFVIVWTAILISSTGIENDFLVCLSTHLLD